MRLNCFQGGYFIQETPLMSGGVPKLKAASRTDDEQYRKKLTPQEYAVLRESATEPPFTGALLHNADDGTYACKACGNVLFDSKTKFDSGCGWPSFYDALKGSVEFRNDYSYGSRVEVTCSKCGSHLGHVFDDGPAPTGKRFCMNSVALSFQKVKQTDRKKKGN
jgi:peptide-methionine (R)-S-oxide reductase